MKAQTIQGAKPGNQFLSFFFNINNKTLIVNNKYFAFYYYCPLCIKM